VNSILRSKLEELFRHIAENDDALRVYIKTISGGKHAEIGTGELDSLKALAVLYFPSLTDAMNEYVGNCRELILWAIGRSEALDAPRAAADRAAIDAVFRETHQQYGQAYAENIRLRSVLERQAADLMQVLLALPDALTARAEPV